MQAGPPHIQRLLDEAFPGVRLEWNERTGYFVLSDDLFHVDGSVDYSAAYPPPGGLVGIEPYPLTRRALIWALGDPRTFERWEPCADLILNTLYQAHNGGRIDAIEEFIDKIEDGEAASAHRAKQAERERARDVAGSVFDRVVRGRSTFSSEHVSTPQKVDRDLAARELASADANADAEAAALINSGKFAHGGTL
jgi:hypothetical protein